MIATYSCRCQQWPFSSLPTCIHRFSLYEVSFVDQFPPSRSKYLPGAWSTLEIHSRLSNFPNYKYEVKYEWDHFTIIPKFWDSLVLILKNTLLITWKVAPTLWVTNWPNLSLLCITLDLASFRSIVDFSINSSLTTLTHLEMVDFWLSTSFWAFDNCRWSLSWKSCECQSTKIYWAQLKQQSIILTCSSSILLSLDSMRVELHDS